MPTGPSSLHPHTYPTLNYESSTDESDTPSDGSHQAAERFHTSSYSFCSLSSCNVATAPLASLLCAHITSLGPSIAWPTPNELSLILSILLLDTAL